MVTGGTSNEADRGLPDRDQFENRLGLIALAALAVRIAYLVVEKRGTDACGAELCGDAVYYSGQAHKLAAGRWFADPSIPGMQAADHPPLTALVASPASFLFDESVIAQRASMVLVGVAAVVVIGLLARRVGGPRTGLIAAGLAAVYPYLWMNDAVVMAEALTALLVAATLLALYRHHDQPSLRAALVVGLLCGLAMLARGEQGLLIPIVVAPTMLWTRSIPPAERLKHLLAVAVVAGAVVAPWVIHNLARFEEPTLLSTNDGLTLLGANCDGMYHGGGVGFWSLDCALESGHEGDQSIRSAARRDAAFDYIRANSGEVPRVVAIRLGRVWGVWAPDEMVWYNTGEGRESWASWFGFAMYVPLVPLAVAGGVVLRRDRRLLWPLASTAIVVTLTAALFYGLLRFRIPAEVAIVALAAVALDRLWSRLRPSEASPVASPTRVPTVDAATDV